MGPRKCARHAPALDEADSLPDRKGQRAPRDVAKFEIELAPAVVRFPRPRSLRFAPAFEKARLLLDFHPGDREPMTLGAGDYEDEGSHTGLWKLELCVDV